MVIEDLKVNLEKSQYVNKKVLSINHYLVNLLNLSQTNENLHFTEEDLQCMFVDDASRWR